MKFRKPDKEMIPMLQEWFQKPHIQEYWGTDDYTWNNLVNNILYGKKDLFDYWVSYYDNEPLGLLLTTDATEGEPEHLMPFVEKTGVTLTLDVMIGNDDFLGKGFAAEMIKNFLDFLGTSVTAVLIDPESRNSKAIHVYQKAGFIIISKFSPLEGEFQGKEHFLMKWKR